MCAEKDPTGCNSVSGQWMRQKLVKSLESEMRSKND